MLHVYGVAFGSEAVALAVPSKGGEPTDQATTEREGERERERQRGKGMAIVKSTSGLLTSELFYWGAQDFALAAKLHS